MPSYLAIGDLGVDSVALVDHLPRTDEKLWVTPQGDFAGGMMGNAAATVASLGVSAGVVSLVGSDERGTLILEELRRRGVSTEFVRRVEGATFWTLSLTVPSGDRTLLQFRTPAFGADWEGFDFALLGDARWVHTIAEEGEPAYDAVRKGRASGTRTSLDIEYPFVLDDALPSVLPFIDVAFLNSAAADGLGGPEQAAAQLRAQGAGTVAVTLGERGAYLLERSGRAGHLPAHEVEAIDTNGAGDAFAGAFAAASLKGFDEREAAELAVLVAGRSTTVFGGFGLERALEDLRETARNNGSTWWDRL